MVEHDKNTQAEDSLITGSGKRMMSKEFTLLDQESHIHKALTPENFPGILHGSKSQEKMLQQKLMARKAHLRHIIATIALLSFVLVVVVSVALWFTFGTINKQKAAESAQKQSTSQPISAKSSSVTAKLAGPKPIEYQWGPTVQQISPTDYLQNVYGKQKQFFLILGSSSDAHFAKLAQATVKSVNEFGMSTPIYFVDAAKYYYAGDGADETNYQKLLASMGLIKKVAAGDNVKTQDFKSTLFAGKLTKQNGQATYSIFKANATTWTATDKLHAWLKQVTPQLFK